ncbi:MAG: hypothetical protein HYX84_02585 [Chloroflexi bacterium]|nr:hypothetical protein [Chloroflexota bacterium]
MNPAGYLLNTFGGLTGDPGIYYQYILAGNGLFVSADNEHLRATIIVSPARVRGLAPIKESFEMLCGKIPGRLCNLAISIMAGELSRERYLAVIWESGEYRLRMPAQQGVAGAVTYETLPNTIMDIHSHHKMKAFFSSTDDRDEQGFRIYMVAGRLDTFFPEVMIRLGVYGYFMPLDVNQVFDL